MPPGTVVRQKVLMTVSIDAIGRLQASLLSLLISLVVFQQLVCSTHFLCALPPSQATLAAAALAAPAG